MKKLSIDLVNAAVSLMNASFTENWKKASEHVAELEVLLDAIQRTMEGADGKAEVS